MWGGVEAVECYENVRTDHHRKCHRTQYHIRWWLLYRFLRYLLARFQMDCVALNEITTRYWQRRFPACLPWLILNLWRVNLISMTCGSLIRSLQRMRHISTPRIFPLMIFRNIFFSWKPSKILSEISSSLT